MSEVNNFIKQAKEIVEQAQRLKDLHTPEKDAPVNYACFFAQSEEEYQDLLEAAKGLGKIGEETKMGPVFVVEPIETSAGKLRVVKIRKPDPTRPERGDADFTVSNYQEFKKEFLGKSGFTLFDKPGKEMIELMDPAFNVRVYFSKDPLDKKLGLV